MILPPAYKSDSDRQINEGNLFTDYTTDSQWTWNSWLCLTLAQWKERNSAKESYYLRIKLSHTNQFLVWYKRELALGNILRIHRKMLSKFLLRLLRFIDKKQICFISLVLN